MRTGATEQTDAMRLLSLLLVVGLSSTACSSGPDVGRAVVSPASTTSSTTASAAGPDDAPASVVDVESPSTSSVSVAVAFNGRSVPRVASTPQEAATLFVDAETGLRVDGADPVTYADLGHMQQLVIRQLMRNQEWIEPFHEALPEEFRAAADLHITARRELGLLHTGGGPPIENIPAWSIIEPEPLDVLTEHYRRAEEATGIPWQVLAAINLIETGMGRIDGLSSAGAQGPMQFLPTTWAEVSTGGDIDDPGDAIDGAARYLVQRGGLDDIRAGLFGYNNSDNYVKAVLAYAELVELDERALRGFYNWEVYVGTSSGTLWLPVGYLSPEPTPAFDYVAQNPWALTLG